MFPVAQRAARFAGEADAGFAAEAEAAVVAVHFFGAVHQRDFAGADVGRFLHNAAHVERGVNVGVAHGMAADAVRAGVERGAGTDFAVVEGFGDREGLHHRAELENVGDGAVAALVGVGLARLVRVV